MQELLSQRFEAQRQKLVSMDIVAVAESLGMTLKPGSSGTYYWEEHDSFHIYPNTNTFRWWSRSIGTNTIDLVQVVQEEMTGHKPTFREATSFLETGQFNNVTVQPIVKEPFEYYLERYEHSDFNIGRQYLKEERGLSDETIDTFLASGNLATATRKKGGYFEPVIVFKSRDNDGKMIGASLQGIVENRVQHPERGRLKQIMKNSEGTAGFSLDIGTPKRLVFAEAPIDLMSYYEVNKDDLQDVKLVAMDGLKKSVVSRYVADLLTDGNYSQTMSTEQIRGALDALNKTTNILQEHPDMITLAVDNDSSGRDFVENLIKDGIPVIADLPPKSENQPKMDWNDYLKQRKKEAKPMENHAIKKPNKDQLALFDNLVDLSQKKDKKEKQTPAALTSYGSFRIDDEFLERRYGTQPREDAITTVLNALKNNLSLESIGVDNDPTECAFVSTVDVEGYQLDLAVYSHTPELEPHGRYDWSLLVLEKTEPVGFLAYGEDWFKEQANLKEKLTDLQTWINQKSVKKHLLTQQAYNHFLESLDEKTQEVTSISYEDYKQEMKDFEEMKKTLSQNQESNTGGERFNRNSSSLGDDSPGTAPKPVEYETQPNFPTNVPFHFSIDRSKKSTVKLRDGYTYATDKKIRQLNLFADDIKKSANWYLDNISDSQITYFYQDGNFVSSLRVQFEKKNWMHLTGIAPVYSNWVDSLSEQFIDDVARGHGEFANLSLGRGVMEKIQILPMLPEVLETDSFVFDDLSSVQKFQRFDAKRAIRTDNEQLVLAFKMKDDTLHPATLLKPSKKLNIVLDELNQEKTILGVIIEKDGKVNVHRVNEDYVKDGGLEMKSIVENKQFEEVKVTKTDVTAKKQKAKDSDGDGLTDDEEIALGTNPYSPDTDGDGVIDSIERGSGTDATNPSDTPDNRQKEQMKHNLVLSEMIKAKDTAALNQHLQEGIKDYFDSDTYKNYLEGMAHFNHYSARNIQLIKAQLPEATMVASFEEWKKRNGHVNKGEKALYVQAPVTVIKKDADGKPVINADTGEKETLTYFKPVPVFDISQISPQQGKQLNLPKSSEAIPAQLNKDYYQNIYRALRDISQKENGIPIRFRELEQSDGFYNPKTNNITIKKGMTYEQTLLTLIHEMAHSELHNNQSLAEHFKGKLTRSSEELQAESVAYVVSNHLGFDTSNDSFAYLASWSQEPDGLENLKAQLEIVQEEASSLMNRIDKQLTKYQTLTVSKDETLTETQKRNLEKSANPFYQSLQKAKAKVNNMKKGDEPNNEQTVKKDNRPTKC